jgi:glutamate-1-semialdehyde 2,1-aminomutase
MISTVHSGKLFRRSQESLAGGVSSNVRSGDKPVPLFFKKGKGSRIQDVDGNEYIDYVLGQGPLILGHSHPDLILAVQKQIEEGQLFAGQHPMEIELSEKLQALIPCAELVRYCNSGSEAVHAALRLAKAFTGREKVIKFEGHYHGWFDNILISVHPPLGLVGSRNSPQPILGTKGQSSNLIDNIIVLPWNDLDLFKGVMEVHGHECAAVIMEPIMCNTGCILPKEGYLEGVRETCSRNGTILIFDEIITGFRLGLGGAQAFFGVTPDLATFGKAMGGGFPISCFVGSKKIMGLIGQGEVNHSGTFNSNVTVIAAALATLAILEKEEFYKHIYSLGIRLMDGLRVLSQGASQKFQISGLGPMFHMSFTDGEPFYDYRTLIEHTDPIRRHQMVVNLLERGVRVTSRGLWYLSAAHTEEDITTTLQAAASALKDFRKTL